MPATLPPGSFPPPRVHDERVDDVVDLVAGGPPPRRPGATVPAARHRLAVGGVHVEELTVDRVLDVMVQRVPARPCGVVLLGRTTHGAGQECVAGGTDPGSDAVGDQRGSAPRPSTAGDPRPRRTGAPRGGAGRGREPPEQPGAALG